MKAGPRGGVRGDLAAAAELSWPRAGRCWPAPPRAARRRSLAAAAALAAGAGVLAVAGAAAGRAWQAFTHSGPPLLSGAPLRNAHALRATAAPGASLAPFDAVADFSGNGTAFALHPGTVPLAPPEEDAVQYHIDTFSPGFVVDRVLTREACRQLVGLVEQIGFTERWSQKLGVVTLFVDEEFERGVFQRLKPFLPDHMGSRPIGINRRWAVIKYGPGEYMNSHIDGHVPGTIREGDGLAYAPRTRSYMSALFWLADDVVGGETVFTFPQGGVWVKVPPRTGAALLFNHGQNAVSNPLHHGGSVVSGYKYLVRSDVIYGLG